MSSIARSMSSSSTSRCVDGPRDGRDGSSRTARRRHPRSRASASAALEAEPADVELDEVRLDLLEVDREPGRVPAAPRAGARARGRRRAARRGGRARRAPPPRRSRPAASRRRRGASRATPAPSVSREPASSAPSGQPSPFERQSVTVSKRAAISAGATPLRDGGVEQPRAVEMDREPELARSVDDGVELVERPARGRPSCCACPRARAPRRAGRRPSCSARRRPRTSLDGEAPARRPVSASVIEPGVRRRAAVLVDHDVCVLLRDEDVAGPRVELERDLVRHRRRRQEERRLLPEQRGRALLQLVDGRVLALLLVADLGLRDRRAACPRSAASPCRSGGRSRDANATVCRVDLDLLERTLAERGEPAYRARQVWEWAARGAVGYDAMTNLPRALRGDARRRGPVLDARRSRPSSVRATAPSRRSSRPHDGHPVEAVLMRYRDGRRSVCVSSQSGLPAHVHVLRDRADAPSDGTSTASEILDQALHFRRTRGRRTTPSSWGWASRC